MLNTNREPGIFFALLGHFNQYNFNPLQFNLPSMSTKLISLMKNCCQLATATHCCCWIAKSASAPQQLNLLTKILGTLDDHRNWQTISAKMKSNWDLKETSHKKGHSKAKNLLSFIVLLVIIVFEKQPQCIDWDWKHQVIFRMKPHPVIPCGFYTSAFTSLVFGLLVFGYCRSMSAKPAAKCCLRKRTSPDCLRIRWNCNKQ